MIKVIIAEDQKLLRESFKNIIERNSDIQVVATAANGREALDLCGEFQPDVVLMDISMPVCNGTEATRMIKTNHPAIKVLVLTSSNDELDVAEAFNNGADGYVLKSIGAEELILSIKSTFMGLEIIHKDVFKPSAIPQKQQKPEKLEKPKNKALSVEGIEVELSGRDLMIIQMIIEGKDNKEIGAALFIAEGTVKNSVTEIISKLQLKDRTQLAVFAIKNHLI